MKRVFLQYNSGFQWVSLNDCFVKGCLFDKAGKYYSGKDLPEYFHGVDSFSDFEERVRYANGCFSVILKNGDEIFAAVDKIRSLPLFYVRFEGSWLISDNPQFIAEKTETYELNTIGSTEFLATGYVTGNETLVHGIRQIQAGEIIHFKEDDKNQKFYYSYRVPDTIDNGYDEMRKAGIQVFDNAFERMVKSLEGKTAVVPLSGGYDSRLIVAMLRKHNIKDVICFTYGRKDNPETELSSKVAAQLGFKWYYIEYTEDVIKDFIKDEVFADYFPFASNLVSMFFMQEYFAVKYLHDNNLIPENSVFIPGHSGDFLGGSQLNKHGNLNLEEDAGAVVQRIYDVKYCLRKPPKKLISNIQDRIHRSLQEKYAGENSLAYSVHEDWDFKEKLAKFNFNSITTYTYFGYSYRLPFWDNELLDFFKYLPLHVKINKYLYDDILSNVYFEPFGLNFTRELQLSETDIRRLKLKSQIKKHLPDEFVRLFVTVKDGLFYNEITQYFKEDLHKNNIDIKIHGNSYNSIITQWYYYKVQEYLKRMKA